MKVLEPTSDVRPNRRGLSSAWLVVIGLVGVAVIVIAIANDSSTTSADTDEQNLANSDIDMTDAADISEAEASRIRDVMDDEELTEGPPYAQEISGTIVDVSQDALSIKVDDETYEWPLASDMEVWKSGELDETAALHAGDSITVYLQQLGSRQNGWMNAIARIAVNDSSAASAVDPSETRYVGRVIEIGTESISIRNSFDNDSTLRVDPTVVVTRENDANGEKEDGLSSVSVGDRVELFGERIGSQSDGWKTVVGWINVVAPNAK